MTPTHRGAAPSTIATRDPPAITHPEYFYGFLGVAIAWQVMFIVIALDPSRHRAAMPIGLLEKISFGAAAIALFVAPRVSPQVLFLGLFDLLLGALFVAAT
jgi:hypothetical protein